MVTGVLGAASNGPAVSRRVPRDRITATVALELVWAVTPPAIICVPDQPRIMSTSGALAQADQANEAMPEAFDVAV